MKITINPYNLKLDDSFVEYNKVRAVVENKNNEIIITEENGVLIFPGGKMENGENTLDAIVRELKEETGIDFKKEDLEEKLVIDAYYDNFYDYRFDHLTNRHNITTYFYVKTDEDLKLNDISLTEQEIDGNFKVKFITKEELKNKLNEENSEHINAKYFIEENKIILKEIIEKAQK